MVYWFIKEADELLMRLREGDKLKHKKSNEREGRCVVYFVFQQVK